MLANLGVREVFDHLVRGIEALDALYGDASHG